MAEVADDYALVLATKTQVANDIAQLLADFAADKAAGAAQLADTIAQVSSAVADALTAAADALAADIAAGNVESDAKKEAAAAELAAFQVSAATAEASIQAERNDTKDERATQHTQTVNQAATSHANLISLGDQIAQIRSDALANSAVKRQQREDSWEEERPEFANKGLGFALLGSHVTFAPDHVGGWLDDLSIPPGAIKGGAGYFIWGPFLTLAGYTLDDAILMAKHPFASLGGGAQGTGHGLAMVLNHLTFNSYFGWLDTLGIPLDSYVDQRIEENGGLYRVADWSARIGAHALHLIAVIKIGGATGLLDDFTVGVIRDPLHVFFRPGASGPWMHGARTITDPRLLVRNMTGRQVSTWTSGSTFRSFVMPILKGRVPAIGEMAGLPARNCVTAAFRAFGKGWKFW